MRVSPLYNIVKKSYSFEGCVFPLFCTICAFMTEILFIFCDTFGFIGFLTVKLTASEKSITVRNKTMKNEQQQIARKGDSKMLLENNTSKAFNHLLITVSFFSLC